MEPVVRSLRAPDGFAQRVNIQQLCVALSSSPPTDPDQCVTRERLMQLHDGAALCEPKSDVLRARSFFGM